MNDKDKMPWGKYEGKLMEDVPADYFIWLLENNKCSGDVKKYIQENEKSLRMEIANNKKGIR